MSRWLSCIDLCNLSLYIADDASVTEVDADGMSSKITAVDSVKRMHRRNSSLSSLRCHSLSPTKQGLLLLGYQF